MYRGLLFCKYSYSFPESFTSTPKPSLMYSTSLYPIRYKIPPSTYFS